MSSMADRLELGFANGDHSLVICLLSQIESLKLNDMRVRGFSFPTLQAVHQNVPLLNLAACHSWLDIVRQLIIDFQCDPQSRDDDDTTPLHHAARKVDWT